MLAPSSESFSGYHLCTYIWGKPLEGQRPFFIFQIVLLGLYPFALITGLIISLACNAIRRRAAFVAVAAGLGLVALSAFYVEIVLESREFVQFAFQINGWFYLSHALCLACLILSVVEFRKKPA